MSSDSTTGRSPDWRAAGSSEGTVGHPPDGPLKGLPVVLAGCSLGGRVGDLSAEFVAGLFERSAGCLPGEFLGGCSGVANGRSFGGRVEGSSDGTVGHPPDGPLKGLPVVLAGCSLGGWVGDLSAEFVGGLFDGLAGGVRGACRGGGLGLVGGGVLGCDWREGV